MDEERTRLATWSSTLPDPPDRLEDTPADREALERFLRHFSLCS